MFISVINMTGIFLIYLASFLCQYLSNLSSMLLLPVCASLHILIISYLICLSIFLREEIFYFRDVELDLIHSDNLDRSLARTEKDDKEDGALTYDQISPLDRAKTLSHEE